jgi:DNA-binding NarL/FixJ family response regulator
LPTSLPPLARPLRVALVDDHPLMREGTLAALSGDPAIRVVSVAENGEAALRLLERDRPDIMVLDLQMPGISGTEVTRRTKRLAPDVRVLVLTAYDTPTYVRALRDLGARGFISKESSGEQIRAAVLAVGDGRLAFWSEASRESEGRTGPSVLSSRERQVLALLGEGHSNAEIAAALDVSQRTVEVHVSHILDKLGARSRREAVQLVREGTIG